MKIFLKFFRSDKNIFRPIMRVKACIVGGEYQICKELIDEFKMVEVIERDKRDEIRVNIRFSNGKG